MFYNQAKKHAIERLKEIEKRYNALGEKANDAALNLYRLRKSAAKEIDRIETYVNFLANFPKEFIREIGEIKINIQEFNEAARIEEKSAALNIKGASAATAGVAAGGAIATLGPTAAMAIATTFGTASTGTAIASLSGAAATNAALAWLGGGALTAGGGGMAAGNAFLALAGPVGWGLAATMLVGTSVFSSYKNKKAAEKAMQVGDDIERKIAALRPKLCELEQLVNKTSALKQALDIALMVNTYPKDYLSFSIEQKQCLAALINNAKSMGNLINQKVA